MDFDGYQLEVVVDDLVFGSWVCFIKIWKFCLGLIVIGFLVVVYLMIWWGVR